MLRHGTMPYCPPDTRKPRVAKASVLLSLSPLSPMSGLLGYTVFRSGFLLETGTQARQVATLCIVLSSTKIHRD
jgi:hypothetical protein